MDISSLQSTLEPLLYPFGKLYGLAMATRRALWEKNVFQAYKPPCPCVAVGNISWGGTGKTPLVGWLLDWAERTQLNAVVLSRGYKAKAPSPAFEVNLSSLPEEVGDEPLMLAREHRKAHIYVDPQRTRSADHAVLQHKPQIMLLDDGFQHLAIQRDVNLVLLAPDDLSKNWNRVLPAGSWREGKSALSRADAFIFKVHPLAWDSLYPQIEERLFPFKRPVYSYSLVPNGLIRVEPFCIGALAETKVNLEGAEYILTSGVGNPNSVLQTATTMLGAPKEYFVYPDHHLYSAGDAQLLHRTGLPVICTPKDAIKLEPFGLDNLWTFQLDVRFGPHTHAECGFIPWWHETWKRLTPDTNFQQE